MDLLNPLAGFLVGVLVGFTGVGGGALMTPLLVFLFGVAPQTAIGTDLLFASITKGFGGWVHGSRGSIDWLILLHLCAGSLPAAVLALALIHYFPPDKGLRALLMAALGIALAVTSVAMLSQPTLRRLGQKLSTTTPGAIQACAAGTDRGRRCGSRLSGDTHIGGRGRPRRRDARVRRNQTGPAGDAYGQPEMPRCRPHYPFSVANIRQSAYHCARSPCPMTSTAHPR